MGLRYNKEFKIAIKTGDVSICKKQGREIQRALRKNFNWDDNNEWVSHDGWERMSLLINDDSYSDMSSTYYDAYMQQCALYMIVRLFNVYFFIVY